MLGRTYRKGLPQSKLLQNCSSLPSCTTYTTKLQTKTTLPYHENLLCHHIVCSLKTGPCTITIFTEYVPAPGLPQQLKYLGTVLVPRTCLVTILNKYGHLIFFKAFEKNLTSSFSYNIFLITTTTTACSVFDQCRHWLMVQSYGEFHDSKSFEINGLELE